MRRSRRQQRDFLLKKRQDKALKTLVSFATGQAAAAGRKFLAWAVVGRYLGKTAIVRNFETREAAAPLEGALRDKYRRTRAAFVVTDADVIASVSWKAMKGVLADART